MGEPAKDREQTLQETADDTRAQVTPRRRPTPRNLFSFSRVKTFFQCPARYRFRYVKGMREGFQSIEAHLGTTVHAVLEWVYQEREGGTTPGAAAALEELERRWHEGWDEKVAVVRRGQRPEEVLGAGRQMLERFYAETLPRDQSTTVALEVRLSQGLSDGVTLTGIADRIGRTSSGRLFVVDYKTSRSLGDPSEMSEGLQAPIYAACALKRWDEPEALAGYHYLRHAVTRWQPVSRARGEQLLARFDQLVAQARSATELEARPSVLCAWCGFNHVCPEAVVPEDLDGGRRHASRSAGL
jgi:putative RecB family exonuclease